MSKEAQLNDFGLLIAYVLPGFIALWGLDILNPELGSWLLWAGHEQPTVAGFLYSSVVAIAAGLTVSTIRWLTLDPLHHATGIRPPNWDFARLEQNVRAFNMVLEGHYRFYLWYANSLVSLVGVFLARRFAAGSVWPLDGWDVSVLVLLPVFFLGSRDTLQKYYTRAGSILLRSPQERGQQPMESD